MNITMVTSDVCSYISTINFNSKGYHDEFSLAEFLRTLHPGLLNYQILLLVHRQVNGETPLVKPSCTCPKIDFFKFFEKKKNSTHNISQQTHNVVTMSLQRHDVAATLLLRCVFAGLFSSDEEIRNKLS